MWNEWPRKFRVENDLKKFKVLCENKILNCLNCISDKVQLLFNAPIEVGEMCSSIDIISLEWVLFGDSKRQTV